jgi:hypothetical protein
VNNSIKDMADKALNEMCAKIQDELKVTDGGLAGLFFSDNVCQTQIENYIISEISSKILEIEEWFDKHPETEGVEANYPQLTEMNQLKGMLEEYYND